MRQLGGDVEDVPARQLLARRTSSPSSCSSCASKLAATEEGRVDGRRARQVAEAGVLFAQGLGQTPYQQAKSQAGSVRAGAKPRAGHRPVQRAIDLDPRYAAAHAGLGEARLRLYRLTKHPEDLDLAGSPPAGARPRRHAARRVDDARDGARAEGRYGGGREGVREAIARNPKRRDTRRELGLAYQRARQWEKAEAGYGRRSSCDPIRGPITTTRRLPSTSETALPEAEAAFRRALELAPTTRVWSNLGAVSWRSEA